MMAFFRACLLPLLQREINSSSGGQTPGMRAHVPWMPRGGCLGHVLRGDAWADRRAGSCLFFASCLREYSLARDPRHREFVLQRATPIGGVRGYRERGAGQVRRANMAPGVAPAAAILLSASALWLLAA